MSVCVARRHCCSIVQSITQPVEEDKEESVFLFNRHECDSSPLLALAMPSWWSQQRTSRSGASLLFSDTRLEVADFAQVRAHQTVNRVPHLTALLMKAPLFRALQGADVGVRTWIFPDDRDKMVGDDEQVYVVKASVSCGGKGVRLVRGMAQVRKMLENETTGGEFVVQPYLDNPVLLDGRKTDLRVYVLVVGSGQKSDPFRGFLFRRGLVRLAADAYAPPSDDNMGQTTMHLANDAVNNTKRPLSELLQSFEALEGQICWQRMARLCSKVLAKLQRAVRVSDTETPAHLEGKCFQLLGFDVYVDTTTREVSLLEVNSKPCMSCDLEKSSVAKSINVEVMNAALQLGSCAGNDTAMDEMVKTAFSHLVIDLKTKSVTTRSE